MLLSKSSQNLVPQPSCSRNFFLASLLPYLANISAQLESPNRCPRKCNYLHLKLDSLYLPTEQPCKKRLVGMVGMVVGPHYENLYFEIMTLLIVASHCLSLNKLPIKKKQRLNKLPPLSKQMGSIMVDKVETSHWRVM